MVKYSILGHSSLHYYLEFLMMFLHYALAQDNTQ